MQGKGQAGKRSIFLKRVTEFARAETGLPDGLWSVYLLSAHYTAVENKVKYEFTELPTIVSFWRGFDCLFEEK